ncbi:MAG: 2OG-Fe(II) oxygenase [Bacteriovorax sp.]
MIKNELLKKNGFVVADFPLAPIVLGFLQDENWRGLDQYFLDISKDNGQLRNFLADYLDFVTLEHIIAIRRAPDDEEGIWHDDGSRLLGFSLSLNRDPKTIVGGELRFKRKESTHTEVFPPLPYGKIVLFLSGIYGFEHMVSAVTKGERIVIAGWCS